MSSNSKLESLAVDSNEKLNDRLVFFKKELFNLRFQRVVGELKNTARFKIVKRSIARIKTELTMRAKKSGS